MREKLKESIRYYYNQGIIVNYGIHVYNERNYERAIDAFETHSNSRFGNDKELQKSHNKGFYL